MKGRPTRWKVAMLSIIYVKAYLILNPSPHTHLEVEMEAVRGLNVMVQTVLTVLRSSLDCLSLTFEVFIGTIMVQNLSLIP